MLLSFILIYTLNSVSREQTSIILSTMTDSTVTPCSSYFECYNNEALDPFAGSYKNLMATFCVSIGREPNARARQLYEQLFVTSKVVVYWESSCAQARDS